MNQEMEFKNIVAQYSKVKPEEMTGEMRFREDLGFTSLDFMSFLGELESVQAHPSDSLLAQNRMLKIPVSHHIFLPNMPCSTLYHTSP